MQKGRFSEVFSRKRPIFRDLYRMLQSVAECMKNVTNS